MSSHPENMLPGLFDHGIDADTYGTGQTYSVHLLEQYKLYVEMADRTSSRRNLANTFFLTLNTGIIAAIGFALDKGVHIGRKWTLIGPLIALLALCFSWWCIVKSYRKLNEAKFKVINEIEKRLPACPYCAEWKCLGEGQEPKLYRELTKIENWIPVVFAVLYVIGTIMLIV